MKVSSRIRSVISAK